MSGTLVPMGTGNQPDKKIAGTLFLTSKRLLKRLKFLLKIKPKQKIVVFES